jgi:taurine---2-oxoglutarate transaminase
MTTEPSTYPFFFTWTAQRTARPIEIVGGDGAWFTTAAGGRWLDLGSLSYQASLGHGNRRVIDAIKAQADQLCISSPTSVFPAKIELAKRLLALAPDGFTKVFFTLGGAEANENAIKLARLVTGRRKVISRYRSYHGATLGAATLTGDWRRVPFEPGLPGVVHALDCYCDRCPFGQELATCHRECARHIGQLMELEGQGTPTVAAVILEPVPGANGVLVPPPEYWPIVREACDREGALLIADEVLTGFGRTGTPFGFQHWDVVPDLITVAKALTGGYATLGAVLVHERVAAFFEDQVLPAGLTFYAHPLACAAAVECLRIYDDDGLYQRAAELGPVLRAELDAIAARLALSGVRTFVRGLGLLAVLEVEAPAAAWHRLGDELRARRLSLHVDGGRGTAIFAPPLCIAEDDLVAGVRGFGEAAQLAFGGTP